MNIYLVFISSEILSCNGTFNNYLLLLIAFINPVHHLILYLQTVFIRIHFLNSDTTSMQIQYHTAHCDWMLYYEPNHTQPHKKMKDKSGEQAFSIFCIQTGVLLTRD